MTVTFGVLFWSAVFAQAAVTHDYGSALLTYGPLGIICAYLLYRDERRDKAAGERSELTNEELRKLSHRLSGMSKALIVDVLARSIDEHTRKIAQDLLEKNGNGTEHT